LKLIQGVDWPHTKAYASDLDPTPRQPAGDNVQAKMETNRKASTVGLPSLSFQTTL
jgi:hypothetical protein